MRVETAWQPEMVEATRSSRRPGVNAPAPPVQTHPQPTWGLLGSAEQRVSNWLLKRRSHIFNDAIGDRVGLPVYYFSDDFRHFFYQIRVAVRCLWYCGRFLYDPTTGLGLFVVELALAMGYTPALVA